jgi:hypothetical protein
MPPRLQVCVVSLCRPGESTVFADLREQLGTAWRRAACEPSYAAVAISSTAHIALLIALAWLWIGADSDAGRQAALDSRWQPAETALPLTEVETAQAEATFETDGGRAAVSLPPLSAEPDLPIIVPAIASAELADASAEQVLAQGLADNVGVITAADDGRGGRGEGNGTGLGDGDGRKFFGAESQGHRFVYVVDRSGSMNHPHDSDAKTRFRRLKFELLSSIGRMTPDQEFYIVFFNEDPHPMPARTLQPATPEAKQHYLEWMSRMRAVGRTDPRRALQLALRLEPDTIYFLSDGSFQHKIARDLRKIRQRRAVIHTFAFGETAGRETLESVAENNGGKYHFVP